MHTENKAQCKNVEEIYNAAALELLQLQEMRKVEKEEKAMMTSPMHAKLVLKLQKECNKLEHRLKALNTVEKSYEEERVKESQEMLVTRSVTLEEVRRDLEGWKEALGAEYKSLIDHGAIRPLIEEECQQVKGVNDEVITIPGMLCERRATVFRNLTPSRKFRQEVGLDCDKVTDSSSIKAEMAGSYSRCEDRILVGSS